MLVEDTIHGSYAQFVLHLKWKLKSHNTHLSQPHH